jgi:hypothetical protein
VRQPAGVSIAEKLRPRELRFARGRCRTQVAAEAMLGWRQCEGIESLGIRWHNKNRMAARPRATVQTGANPTPSPLEFLSAIDLAQAPVST